MRDYWKNLSERDQFKALIGAMVLIIYLVYAFVYTPLNGSIRQLEQDNRYQEQLFSWMQQAQLTHQAVKSVKRTPINTDQLLTLFSQQLKQGDFKSFPSQIKQTSDGKIEISFIRVPFTQLMHWLLKNQRQYGMSLTQFTATPTIKSGIIMCQMTLSLSNP